MARAIVYIMVLVLWSLTDYTQAVGCFGMLIAAMPKI